jgi:bacteriocin-like protein
MSEKKKEDVKKNAKELSDKNLDKVSGGKRVWIEPIKHEVQTLIDVNANVNER